MTKHRETKSLVILVLVAAAVAGGTADASRHFNLFEPVFGDEQSDAHTVSAGLQNQAEQAAPSKDTRAARADDSPRQQWASNAPASTPSSTTKAELLKKLALSTSNELRKSSNVRRQIESYTNAQNVTSTSVRKRQTTKPPRHWSALENYYEKLRHSLVDKTYRGRPLDSEEHLALEQIVQEGVGQDASYRYQPIYRGDPSGGPAYSSGIQFQPAVVASSVAQPPPPFLFPHAETNSQQPAYIATNPNSGIGSKGLLMSNLGLLSQPLPPVKSITQQTPITIESRPIQQQQQQVYQHAVHTQYPHQLPAQILSWLPGSAPTTGQENLGHQLDNINLRRLKELWQIQQQARAKHQQETYGTLYDARRALELQQEESICGLNQINSQALLSEFPSHMGVYNGTRTSDEDFLCAAAWVHERFALTLASCLKNLPPNASLSVHTGEWYRGHNLTDTQRASMVSRRVSRIHLFPGFQVNSSEHNLALLEWQDPVAISVESPFMVPSCLARSRTSLRANNCWAPVRNTTFVEHFDADGEGETKLRREVKMVRVPVLLFGNEEAECLKQTGVEFFNFKHPNYICSADSRPKLSWRSKLNNADYFGSGIYCNENGYLNLVSILHPMVQGSPSIYGSLDLTYYQIWIRRVIFGGDY